jgi:adenylate cyclase
MRLLGQRLPDTLGRKLAAVAYNCAVQLKSRVLPSRPRPLSPDQRHGLQCASHIYEHLSEQYFFLNDSLAVLNGTLASLNLAEECGAVPETIRGYSALALGLAMSGMVGLARGYSRRAQLLAEQHGSLPELARVQLVVGVLEYGLGEWAIVAHRAEQATALYRKLGDRTRVHNSQAMAAFAALLSGDVETAGQLDQTLGAELSVDSSPQVRAWHLAIRLLLASPRSGVDAEDLMNLRRLADAKLIRTDRLLCLGVVAAGYQRRGELEFAAEAALQGLSVLVECGVVWGGYAYGAAGVVDVLLSSWEDTAPTDPDGFERRRRAELAVRQLARLARTSPICRPFSLLASGRASAIANHDAAARRKWRRAVAVAESLKMPQEEAEARCRLGTTFAPDDPRRLREIERAAEIYGKLGATANVVRARKELSRH